MFQIKDFTSIVASMINWAKSTQSKITDFNIGSVFRTLIEAPASEIDELYQQMFNGLKEAIPAATYLSFDFDALPSQPTSGLLRVTVAASTSDVLISAGTTGNFPNGTVAYAVNVDTTITAGNTYADVLVTAVTAGAAGNVLKDTQFTLSPAPPGFVSATNLAAWMNGRDAESEDDRKLRFNAYIQSLNRGTVAALQYGLKTTFLADATGNVTERVVSASIVEPWKDIDASQPISLVQCYIHNGVGNTSSALINFARDVIYGYYDTNGNAVPGWKAAGVKVDVYAATEVNLDVGGTLTAAAGYDAPTLKAAAVAAVNAYIIGLPIGAPFQVATMIDQIMNIDGVANFVPADVSSPGIPQTGVTAGGTLTATTYYVVTTYVTPSGETVASVEATQAVAADNLLTVASPTAKTGALGWNVYVGTVSGSYEKQNSAMLAFGSEYTEPTSGLIAGTVPPVASTARLQDVAVSKSQKLMPGTVSIP